MKVFAALLCVSLVILGVVLALRTDPARADARKPGASSDPAPAAAAADPSSGGGATGKGMPSTAAAGSPDPQVQALQRRLTELRAQHDTLIQEQQRQREAWKQRWAADSAALKAEIAMNDQTIAEEDRRRKEIETRLNETIAAARAEAERARREQADQAAAAATKNQAPQGVSDF
jgi:hypothetical protein